MSHSESSADFSRRQTLAAAALASTGIFLNSAAGSQTGKASVAKRDFGGWDATSGKFVLPALPYETKALEPHIDAETMGIHHSKHHQAYVDGANKALGELRNIRDGGGDAGLVKHWSRELSFHVSGHVNHTLFWNLLAPPGKGGSPAGALASAIDRDFGSFEKFTAHFKTACQQVEGGGWGWLVVEPLSGRLVIVQQEKQQDMVPTWCKPVLGIDVWEHAYYLKYKNNRGAYLASIMSVINWNMAGELFDGAVA